MQKRVELNRKVMDMLWRLEGKQVFARQFNSAQEYFEWSLRQALKWTDRYPHKELRGYLDD